jgi:hypothetical protein
MSEKYGSSNTMFLQDPASHELKGQAEFQPFAPAPCVCCGCLVPDTLRERTFWNIYGNRSEGNVPIAPFGCCTSEICLIDRIGVGYFDKPPHRTGPAPPPCCCIPFTCCGPPVMFAHKPKMCCLDLSSCFGETIKYAPCNCLGLKEYCCCGNPCYVKFSMPLMMGLKNSEAFLAKYKAAIEAYKAKSGIVENEMLIFEVVSDNVADFGGSKKVGVGGGAPHAPDAPEVFEMIERVDMPV